MASGSTPPRRRAQKPPTSSTIPLIALFLGVMVAGLGIGAALSVLGKQRSGPPNAIADATTAPAGWQNAGFETPLPTAVPRRVPTARTTPAPSATQTPSASPDPDATDSPEATDTPVATPSAVATATPAAATASPPTPAPKPAATVAAVKVAVATSAPTAGLATLQTAATQGPETPVPEGESAFSRASTEVVRQYLQALIDGDEATARDTLVNSKGDLPEAAIVDKDSHIGEITVHGTDDTSTVTATIETAGGTYAATYFMTKSPAGNPQIRAHQISRT